MPHTQPIHMFAAAEGRPIKPQNWPVAPAIHPTLGESRATGLGSHT
jgi:hypothetical protein